MKGKIRATIAAAGVAGACLVLAGCGRPEKSVRSAPPAPRQAAAPAQAGEALRGGASEAVWRLRAGLNVAALSCRGRGRQPVASEYARMLSRHRSLLATAYRQEQSRQSLSAFDRQQTRLYNVFANQASPAHFCNTARVVAQRANGLDSAALASAAPRLVSELQASLRRRT